MGRGPLSIIKILHTAILNLNPTPYGHQILADTVLRAIRAAAWI